MDWIAKGTQWFHLFTNQVYIPKEYGELAPPIVMHISDTPEEIYPFLSKLIKKTCPDYIIHTGDLADNLKLGVAPELRKGYEKAMDSFVNSIENFPTKRNYYLLGNHDLLEIVNPRLKRGKAEKTMMIDLGEYRFFASHYYDKTKVGMDYHLFGHSFEPRSHKKEETYYFNGLEAIRFISIRNGKYIELPYPLGTNSFRKMDYKNHIL